MAVGGGLRRSGRSRSPADGRSQPSTLLPPTPPSMLRRPSRAASLVGLSAQLRGQTTLLPPERETCRIWRWSRKVGLGPARAAGGGSRGVLGGPRRCSMARQMASIRFSSSKMRVSSCTPRCSAALMPAPDAPRVLPSALRPRAFGSRGESTLESESTSESSERSLVPSESTPSSERSSSELEPSSELVAHGARRSPDAALRPRCAPALAELRCGRLVIGVGLPLPSP
mmetsp:Transcript_64676/g.193249  ORF Transcript_64676/g.193249 Transcript_64676/m.193249 type:complete len:228 (+) Transcript_64676:116-799(+)